MADTISKQDVIAWTPKLAVQIAVVAALYVLSGQASFSLSVSHGIVTFVVFLAEGVALSSAILLGRRIWPGIFLGQLLLALLNGLSWPLALGVSAINSVEAVIGAELFRRLGIHKRFDQLRDVGLLLALIFLILQPFSASLGTLLLWYGGVIETANLEVAWFSWWVGNSLGQIILVPMLLSFSVLEMDRRTALRSLSVPLLLTGLMGWLIFAGPQFDGTNLGLVLAEPLMILLAARFGMPAVTLATAVLAVLTLYFTHLGTGPFAQGNLSELNFFLLRLVLFGQFVAALFAERKQVEKALSLGQEQLRQAQQIASLGSWTFDLRSKKLIWSDEFYHLLEVDQASGPASEETYLGRVHPEDKEIIASTYADALARQVPFECAHRLIFLGGRIKHVRSRGEFRYAADGTPSKFIGTLLDITSMREAEEQLHLYAHIFEQSSEAIIVSDPSNDIVTVNPAFTRLTGYSVEEVVGRNPRFLASGKTPPETYPALWQALNDHGHWRGELWDQRKDGTVYPKWASISVIRDPAGKLINYIASFIDIGERKAAEEQIQRLAHHDALTGLHNRFSLRLRLEQALSTAQREGGRLAVLFFDMDRFKSINDTLGHHVGDLLLMEVASRLTSHARASDIVARLGGDEFVMVLTGAMDQDAVEGVADKIGQRLGQPYLLEGNELHSSSSIGISLFPEHGTDVDTLMRHSDIAMYHAKNAGRSMFKVFAPSMTDSTSKRQALEQDLRKALADEEFELHYQPQLHVGSNRIFRLEALARWRHVEHGLVSPVLFIPVIDKLGLAEVFGAWVIDEACRQLALWRDKGGAAVRMAVNVSASQLRSSMLLHQTSEAMSRHGIRAGELEFEVGEEVVMESLHQVAGLFQSLHDLGVELAIGNFGAGLLSLVYLRQLPIRTLKLSRELVSDIDREATDANIIVTAILGMARTLSLQVVAEGVETEEQRTFLTAQQCDLLQGYLVSRPLPAEEATRFIRDN